MSQATVPSSSPLSSPSAVSSAATGKPVVDYNPRPTPKRKLPAWMNPRVAIFVGVFGLILGAPVYMFMDEALSGGIHHRADGVIDADLKTLSLFPLDQQNGKTEDVPERFRELSGKKVALVGQMYAPGASGDYVGQFQLCYSIAKCCFSGPPQVQHFVKTEAAKPGTPIPYYNGLVRCTGTMTVDVTRDADKVSSVYHLKLDDIEPVGG